MIFGPNATVLKLLKLLFLAYLMELIVLDLIFQKATFLNSWEAPPRMRTVQSFDLT